jgi:hypothetical protein
MAGYVHKSSTSCFYFRCWPALTPYTPTTRSVRITLQFFVSKNVRRWKQHVSTYLASCNIFLVTYNVRLAPWIALHSFEIYVNASYLLARWLGRCLESGCQRTKLFCTTSRSILSAPSFNKYIGHMIVSKGSIRESFFTMLLFVKPLRVTHKSGHLNIFSP